MRSVADEGVILPDSGRRVNRSTYLDRSKGEHLDEGCGLYRGRGHRQGARVIVDGLKRVTCRLLVVACLASGVHAQQSPPAITSFELGYSIRSWTVDDGLKGPYIGAFGQTRDGALLFSDSRGLIRYNGIDLTDLFESAGPEVPRRDILGIHEDADGRVWTVGLSGQAMREPDGRWVPIGPDRGGRRGVGKLASGPDGRIWCAVNAVGLGLIVSVFEDGRFRQVTEKPLQAGYVQQMEFDADGMLWLSLSSAGSGSSVYRLEGDVLVPEKAPGWKSGALFRKVDDPRLWLLTPGGVRVREGDGWQEVLAFPKILSEGTGFSACVEDRDGNYWIATRSLGLWVSPPDGRLSRVTNEEVKFPDLIRDLFSGTDGTIWFNGENSLLQLRRQPFTLWPHEQRHRHAPVHAMAEDGEGTLWFGGVGIYSLRPGELVRTHGEEDIKIPRASGMLGKPGVGAWYTVGGGDLYSVSEEGRQFLCARPQGFGPFVDLAWHEGSLWAGYSRGTARLENRSLVPDLPEGVRSDGLLCLATGPDDELYVGLHSNGLFRHKDGQWTFTGLEGPVFSVAVAPDHSVWAYRAGSELCRLKDGEWRRANAFEMGLPPGLQMVCSRDGSIWFQSEIGPVIRIDRKAAESWLQGDREIDLKRHIYGRAEGLPAEQAPYGTRKRTIMEDSRGRIWVATVAGTCAWLPSYDARSTQETVRKAPLPVVIEKVLIDGERVPAKGGAVTLEPGKHRLEIDYAGLDLAAPERVSYRYRIEGYQNEWTDAGNRHTAYLQRLPPGDYRFQVIAADRHGVWNEKGASLSVVVLPHWWEHWLFRFGVPVLLLAIVAKWVDLRIRAFRRRAMERARIQEEFSRGLIEAQESERSRIAGELHDDLGQDLLVMKSRIDLARRRSSSESEQDALLQVSDAAAGVLHKVRSLSHKLRPLHLDHLGLAASARSLVKDVAGAARLDYEVVADDIDAGLSPELKVAIYRMLQEALNNVIKHAGANSVKVEFRRHGGNASLIISDDGCGFEGGAERPSREGLGHGLRAMKERCTLLGGTFEVISTPGEGTLIRIELPLSEGREN